MTFPGYKRFKMTIREAELHFDFYKPLEGKAIFTVCELAGTSDMSVVIESGLLGLKDEIAEASYLADMLAGRTPAQVIEWLMDLHNEEANDKKIARMRGIHTERGIRLPKMDTDELLDAAKNFESIFESAYLKKREEWVCQEFSSNDCMRWMQTIQQQLRHDKSCDHTSLPDTTRLFRRAGLEEWGRLFQMTPDKAARDIFNAQKDERNTKRRKQVPYIITDLFETIIDHPYRHAMKMVIDNSSTADLLNGGASMGFNRCFYHYPQWFLDGITPALHPLGPMLLRSPSFVGVIDKLYGENTSDADAIDFMIACYTAAKVYATISELDNDEIKRRQKDKRMKAADPKKLEETLAARLLPEREE